jgi:hypothetical protein
MPVSSTRSLAVRVAGAMAEYSRDSFVAAGALTDDARRVLTALQASMHQAGLGNQTATTSLAQLCAETLLPPDAVVLAVAELAAAGRLPAIEVIGSPLPAF